MSDSRGNRQMGDRNVTTIKVGDRVKIPKDRVFHPEAGHIGKVVYISSDRKTVTVQCERRHKGKKVLLNLVYNSVIDSPNP